MNINSNEIYIDPEWMAITHFFNQYFPQNYDYYYFYEIFNENAKSMYKELVLDKVKLKFKYFFKYKIDKTNADEIINELLKDKFAKREKISENINEQTQLLLSIFDIDKDDNNHFLSKMYMELEEKNKNIIKEKNNENKIINKDELEIDA